MSKQWNWKTDIRCEEIFYTQKVDGSVVPTSIPNNSVNFLFDYRANNGQHFIASRVDGVYKNCKPLTEHSIVIFIPLSRKSLGQGELYRELTLTTQDADFEDGIRNIVIPQKTGLNLWQGPSNSDLLSANGSIISFDQLFSADNDGYLYIKQLNSETGVLESKKVKAGFADHAKTANTAKQAALANKASEALHAETSDSATQSAHATAADHATTADIAAEAGNAITADHADTADLAAEALHAQEANRATETDHALTANHAQSATDASRWEGAARADYLDQGVRTTDGVTFDSLRLRRFLEVPELHYNRVEVTVGDRWSSPCAGMIHFVDRTAMVATLRLEEGEIGTVAVGDICMGIFHADNAADNATTDHDDSRGNRRFAGFATVYFRVEELLAGGRFRYSLRPASATYPTPRHPMVAMTFVGYGSFTRADRRASRYDTRTYQRYLRGVDGWEISAANIAAQFGDLTNLSLHGMTMTGYSAYLDNIYMQGMLRSTDGMFNIDTRTKSILIASAASGMGLAFKPDEGLTIGKVFDPLTGKFAEEYDIAAISSTATSAAATATKAEQDAAEAAQAAAAADAKAQAAQNFLDITLPAEMAEVNRRLDGVVENWYSPYTPTLANAPASAWTTDAERARHIGDAFTSTQPFVDNASTPDAGKSWRWVNEGGYRWTPIADSDAVKALLLAAKAQADANGKSRTFVTTPTTPYAVGDVWTQGAAGDLMRCIAARTSGSYTPADWERATRYTDDSAVKSLQIGGVNLMLNSKEFTFQTNIVLNEKLAVGQTYTLSIEKSTSLVGSQIKMLLYNYNPVGDGADSLNYIDFGENKRLTFIAVNSDLLLYAGELWSPNNSAKIEKLKLERGNKPTDWSPAPEDVVADYTIAANDIATTKANLAKEAANATTAEARRAIEAEIVRLDNAKAALNDVYTKAQADGHITNAELNAISQAQTYANEAKRLAELTAKAYADGIVTAEEERAIADAIAKATAAKEYTDGAVDGIQIGGANLCLKSKNAVYIAGNRKAFDLSSPLVVGQTYTLNFSYTTAADAAYDPTFGFGDPWQGGNSWGLPIAIEPTTFTTTFIAQKADTTIYNWDIFAHYLSFSNVKLERGNKSTDWSPAPEDVQAEIDAAQSAADAATARLTQWASDAIISPTEKTALKQQRAQIVADYAASLAEAQRQTVATTAFTAAYSAAIAAIDKYTAAAPESITIEADYHDIAAYYTSAQAIRNAVGQVTDLSYLKKAFANGSTTVAGGVVLSEFIGIKEGEKVVAGMSKGSINNNGATVNVPLLFAGADDLLSSMQTAVWSLDRSGIQKSRNKTTGATVTISDGGIAFHERKGTAMVESMLMTPEQLPVAFTEPFVGAGLITEPAGSRVQQVVAMPSFRFEDGGETYPDGGVGSFTREAFRYWEQQGEVFIVGSNTTVNADPFSLSLSTRVEYQDWIQNPDGGHDIEDWRYIPHTRDVEVTLYLSNRSNGDRYNLFVQRFNGNNHGATIEIPATTRTGLPSGNYELQLAVMVVRLEFDSGGAYSYVRTSGDFSRTAFGIRAAWAGGACHSKIFGNGFMFSKKSNQYCGIIGDENNFIFEQRSGSSGFRADKEGAKVWCTARNEWIPADRVLYRGWVNDNGINRQWSYDGEVMGFGVANTGAYTITLPPKKANFEPKKDFMVKCTGYTTTWIGMTASPFYYSEPNRKGRFTILTSIGWEMNQGEAYFEVVDVTNCKM